MLKFPRFVVPLVFVTFLSLGFGASSCAHNPAPTVSAVVGQSAFYGEKFLSVVEEAQKQTIASVGTAGITHADVTPAVEVFVQIGKAGQKMAAGLRLIDAAKTDVEKLAAAKSVDDAVQSIQGLSGTLLVHVTSDAVRVRVNQIVSALKLGAALLDVYRQIAPLLPAGGTPPTAWLIPAAMGA